MPGGGFAGLGCLATPSKQPGPDTDERNSKNKNRKVKMHTSNPNVSCFSNKSMMISKKSKLRCTHPRHGRRICTSGLCFESSQWWAGAQDVSEHLKALQLEDPERSRARGPPAIASPEGSNPFLPASSSQGCLKAHLSH